MTSLASLFSFLLPFLRAAALVLLASAWPMAATAQTVPAAQESPVATWNAGSLTLTIPATTPGRTFFMQWSSNLSNWTYLP